MIIECASLSLCLALLTGFCVLFCPCISIQERFHLAWLKKAQTLITLGLAFAYAVLTHAFLNDDFTLTYVAKHSNSLLPWYYKATALWGGHEGSLLLWALILSLWSCLFAWTSRLEAPLVAKTLQVLACVQIGFILLMLATSSPFERSFPDIIIDGLDLNPLLQDLGFIIHPPMLYLGYVGLTLPFAMTVAVLWDGHVPTNLWRVMRSWVLMAWGILSVGIVLGSWWAYYELGWGGWWFWDPVENASFMPWLCATALLHGLRVAHRHPSFCAWTLILAVMGFLLSILGTFLVRSGAISSVHAFASDPKRGLFLLSFLCGLVVVSVGLFYHRRHLWTTGQPIHFATKSGLLFTGSVLLMVVVASICLGTLYPMLTESVTGETLSIGPPYFNIVFIVLMIPVVVLMILATFTQENIGRQTFQVAILGVGAAFCGALGLMTLLGSKLSIHALLGMTLGLWLVFSLAIKVVQDRNKRGRFYFTSTDKAMLLGHLGVAITLLGIVVVSSYEIEKELEIHQGGTYQLGPYQLNVGEFSTVSGDNYVGTQAKIEISKDDTPQKVLFPEKRHYFVQSLAMSETAIWPGLFRDIYVALGEPLGEGRWSARLYYKPLVRFIWLGGLLMLLASIIGLWRTSRRGANLV